MRNKHCETSFPGWRRILAGVAFAGLTTAILPTAALAETYTVRVGNGVDSANYDPGDRDDEVPGDGIAEVYFGSGRTSLRSAIQEANRLPGHDTIIIDLGAVPTLKLRTELPPLTDPAGVTIRVQGEGKFVLDGSEINNRMTSLLGLVTSNFDALDGDDSGDLSFPEIRNLPGADVFGVLHHLGGIRRVDFDQVDTNDDNRVSPEEIADYKPYESGIQIHSPNNVIENIAIVRFPINGLELDTEDSDNNIIYGCYVGTTGTDDAGNTEHGLVLANGAENNIIGGTTAAARCIFSGNGTNETLTDENGDVIGPLHLGHGVLISGPGTTGNQILGSHIGVDVSGETAVPNAFSGVVIQDGASGNFIGGGDAGEGNIISKNGDPSNGCPTDCGNGAQRFYGNGVLVNGDPFGGETATDNVIAGNTVDDNRTSGIRLHGTTGNTVGGTEAGAGNRVTGHGANNFVSSGIALTQAYQALVQGNVTGGNSNGFALSNSIECQIGTPGAGNVFSGDTSGVSVSGGRDNVFHANYIGLNEEGTGARANGFSGFYVTEIQQNLRIGGPGAGEGNVFSGNANHGLIIYSIIPVPDSGAPVIFVQGNKFGTDPTGFTAIPNPGVGILLDLGARNVLIGGSGEGEGNLISGNGVDGIRVARSANLIGSPNLVHILGNKIGVNGSGSGFLPNGTAGVSVYEGGNRIAIGGTGVGEGNVIAGNGRYGVRVLGGSLEVTHEVSVRGNSIYSNGAGAIDLVDDANDNMPAPVIELIGPVRGTAQANSTVDLYADGGAQGRYYLASGLADGSGEFSIAANLSGLPVSNLTATATNPAGSTSEFSAVFSIAPPAVDDQPESVVVVEGEPFVLSMSATGSAPLSYQWEILPEGGSELLEVTDDGTFSGSTSPTLLNSAARLTDAGAYRCVVTNAVDVTATIDVTVQVVPADTAEALVSTLNDISDANTSSPAHLIANPGADGVISLREAIIAANNRAGADVITFNVSGTIVIGSGLPALTDVSGGTTIDGAGQITLDGGNLGGTIGGLQILSGDNVLRGLTLVDFPGNGVDISGGQAMENLVAGCLIGTNGTTGDGNGGHGILIQGGATGNVIGGTTAADRNVVSGNARCGVYITGAGTMSNRVIGNYAGLSANGASAIANGESGVAIANGASGNEIGGGLAGEGNVLSSNGDSGVLLTGVNTTDNVVAGNLIGLNASGTDGLGNTDHGVAFFDGASGNLVGGLESAFANRISGNAGAGVLVNGATTVENTVRNNAITGNFSGGISLSNGGNIGLASPSIDGIGSVFGTAVAGTTVEIFVSQDSQGETLLDTVVAAEDGTFASTVDIAPYIGLFITATSTDEAGNTSRFSSGFYIDLEPPVLTLLGASPATVQCGAVYTDAGASALDDVDGDITARIRRTISFGGVTVPSVDTSVLGTYEILYEVEDAAGQVATPVTRLVNVVDTTAPTITLNGAASVLLECGASYTDAGATATDGCDGTVTVTSLGTVNTSTPGVYPIVYRAEDGAGNAAAEVTRMVTVADTVAPTITVLGSLQVTLECGTPYLDAGATAVDGCDTSVEVSVDNPVEPGVPGVYTVLYDAVDASGNIAAQAFRTVTVTDTIAPVITLLGGADITVGCGLPYNEPGAAVTDTCDRNVPFTVSGVVNTAAPGNYTLVYSAVDASGNVATPVTRIVRVTDNGVPTITLLGGSTVNVPCGGSYSEAGATAVDACEGDLTDAIVVTGSVNTAVAGTYTVNYDVADSAGNRAARVTRTVIVATCPAPCAEQCAGDPDNAVDEDGDGLSACIETCLGTSDNAIDTDGDGVPDGVEVDNGTDPVVPDSDLDLDGDGLTELEEFIFDSDPQDPNSPSVSFFVSPGGANSVGGGSPSSPWATISFAIAQSGASAVNPVRIILADGNYPEDVELIPFITLVGEVGGQSRIEGTVFGAHNSGLENLEIAAFTDDDVMLVMDNVTMRIENVIFRGSAARPAAAILADGPRPGASVIDGCLFTSVSIGIDIAGGLPVIRRCTFEDTTIAGVILRGTVTIGAGASMGDVDNPATGSNLFAGVVQGRAIINESTTTLLAQQNDWGTTDVAAITRNLITGPVTVAPVLAPGSAAETGSLYVTVWTADTQNRITNASVTVSSGAASVTVNQGTNGVYSLPLLRAGGYSVAVSAPGFESQTITVNLAPGQLASSVVALRLPEVKEGGPSCHGGPGSSGGGPSDLLLAALLLGGLAWSATRARGKGAEG